jgi:ceramide glucosyltransferase
MSEDIASGLLVLAGCGVGLIALQMWALRRHMRASGPAPANSDQPISILKPLCGLDDDLMANLESFAALEGARYEVLLGVRDASDAAYPVACRAARRWPERMRVVLQRGEPGLNPKVNQLITLAQRARHDLLVVSDSNVRVERDYLREIGAQLGDPEVGMVTHPIAGSGERSLGALLDNSYMCTVVAPGMVAMRAIARRALVVGKSMAMRRADLEALGGFEAVKDVLAEDHVMGQLVEHQLGKRVAVAHRPIVNLVRTRTMRAFCERYVRWGTIQRRSIGLGPYVALLLLNPVPISALALALSPGAPTLLGVLACFAAKLELERSARRSLSLPAPLLRGALALICKDGLLLMIWCVGLVRNVVVWRGNRLAVLDGTVLMPIDVADGNEQLGARELA